MKSYSPDQTLLLQSENYQSPNIWDDKITPYLLRYLFPSILGGILGGMIVAHFIIQHYAK